SGTRDGPAGTSPYDLVFTDVLDRDAAFAMRVQGRGAGVWWDRLNEAAPNFHRWEQFLGAAVAAAGRPAVVWQIPMGNQFFQSVDNTPGHYQDNRVEYFLDHPDELTGIGVVALLFGAG